MYGFLTFVVIILICTVFYLIRGDTFKGIEYITELKINESSKTYEVKISSEDMCKYYFEDGINIQRFSSIPRKHVNPIMELPVAESSFDIETKGTQTSEITWESDLQTSSNYMEYLKLSGYSELRSVYTPDYIEVFLEKGTIRKRVVIFNSSIMIGNLLKDYELPNIEGYFK